MARKIAEGKFIVGLVQDAEIELCSEGCGVLPHGAAWAPAWGQGVVSPDTAH